MIEHVVGGGVALTVADADSSGLEPRIDVEPEDRLDARLVERAFLDHHLGAAHGLLRRLEEELDGAGEVAAPLGEEARGAEQDRGVDVVAAGVHLARHLRAVGHVLAVLERQRVDVGAQRDARSRPGALDGAEHAGLRDAVAVGNAELVEQRLHARGGAVLLEAELGVAMEIAADLDQPG